MAGGASAEACLHAKESRPIDGFEEKSLSHAKAAIIRLKMAPMISFEEDIQNYTQVRVSSSGNVAAASIRLLRRACLWMRGWR